MKSLRKIVSVIALSVASLFCVNAQMDLGTDIYSSYVWRGTKFGTGAAFQPYVEYAAGDFAIGAWGSVNTGGDEALEMDLYASYSIGDLSITLSDYYFGDDWTDFELKHSIEPSLSYAVGDLSITAAYMFLAGVEDDATTPEDETTDFAEEGDMYFELGYSFESFDITVGAGDGQYVAEDDDFTICNIAVSTSKEIKITEDFSLPVSGSVILNPSKGGFFIVAGLSF